MSNTTYITQESLPWLLEMQRTERKNVFARLSTDSRALLLSMIASHYKEALIPSTLSPLLRESPAAAKYHDLFMDVAKGLDSQELYTLYKQQPDTDKQSLFIGALANKVNEGDAGAFRVLCMVAETSDRMEESRYSALTSLRMLPKENVPRIHRMAKKSLGNILASRNSSPELKHTARSVLQHMSYAPRSAL